MTDSRWVAELVALAGLVLLAYGFVRWCFFSMNALPKGELLGSYPSPSGRYRMDLYIIAGRDLSYRAIRGAVVNTRTRRARTVYWQDAQFDAVAQWIDERTVVVSGSVEGREQEIVLDVVKSRLNLENAR